MDSETHTPNRLAAGDYVKLWRQRRRMSQLDLACQADISTRHLSFIETGRARASRDMLLRLADSLDVPLRVRNSWLLAGGYAPSYSERPLNEDAMQQVLHAIATILTAHEPFPALAVDGHWNLLQANDALASMLQGVAPHLLEAPVNVLRLSLHPEGLAPRIANLAQWRAHLLHRLRRQYEHTADVFLLDLYDELAAYPYIDEPETSAGHPSVEAIAVPLRLRTPAGVLSFISTTMVFGTPLDVTLSEIALETFLPANAETAAALRPA